jgi:hypothetical protein
LKKGLTHEKIHHVPLIFKKWVEDNDFTSNPNSHINSGVEEKIISETKNHVLFIVMGKLTKNEMGIFK